MHQPQNTSKFLLAPFADGVMMTDKVDPSRLLLLGRGELEYSLPRRSERGDAFSQTPKELLGAEILLSSHLESCWQINMKVKSAL